MYRNFKVTIKSQQNLGRLEKIGIIQKNQTTKFVWNVPLLTYTKFNVTPVPVQMGNVLVFVMTLFVPVIETGLVENALKKVKHGFFSYITISFYF